MYDNNVNVKKIIQEEEEEGERCNLPNRAPPVWTTWEHKGPLCHGGQR